jgi:hypothetical protein
MIEAGSRKFVTEKNYASISTFNFNHLKIK